MLETLESRRLLAAAQLDPTFAGDGTALIALAGDDSRNAQYVIRQNDGKFLTIGASDTAAGSAMDWRLRLMRLESDGDLDPTFGTNGIVNSGIAAEGIRAAAIDPLSGRIALNVNGAILMFNADGSRDTSFGFI